MLQRTEIPNFTREQIAQHVIDALEVAALAHLEGADRAAMLPTILDKLCSKQVVIEQVPDVPLLGLPNGQG